MNFECSIIVRAFTLDRRHEEQSKSSKNFTVTFYYCNIGTHLLNGFYIQCPPNTHTFSFAPHNAGNNNGSPIMVPSKGSTNVLVLIPSVTTKRLPLRAILLLKKSQKPDGDKSGTFGGYVVCWFLRYVCRKSMLGRKDCHDAVIVLSTI